jgi:hypothetical protein
MGALLSDKNVKTRKAHQCHGCLETLQPGTEMNRQCVVCDRQAYSIYTCHDCLDFFDEHPEEFRYCDFEDGYEEGYVKHAREHYERHKK